MTNADREEFRKIFVGLAGEWGGTVDTPTLKIKFKALIDYDISEIGVAAGWLTINRKPNKSGSFWPACPTVAEIIEAINSIDGVVNVETRAIIQADVVMRAIFDFGHSKTPNFEDPITKHLTGKNWGDICKMSYVELTWFRKGFIERYMAYADANSERYMMECGGKLGELALSISSNKKIASKGKMGVLEWSESLSSSS